LWFGCEKPEPASTLPRIWFDKYKLTKDTLIGGNLNHHFLLSFHLVDGDADIGYKEEITENDSKYISLNIFPYVKKNGIYEIDTVSYPYHLPYLSEKAPRGYLKAIVQIDMEFLKLTIPQWDTVRFIYFVKDRAQNRSNIDTTPEVKFK